MAFLRSSQPTDHAVLQGRDVNLRPPQLVDYQAWAEIRAASRAHLRPWEPSWPRDDLTKAAYRRRIRHYQRESREDRGYAFHIFSERTGELIGGLTLTNVRRGVTQSTTLGYWLGAEHIGQGHMSDSVRSVFPFVFDTLRLHRLEAAAQPTNIASVRVLENTGFEREGFARRYLKIDGAWQDHILFAVLSEDWMAKEANRA